MSSSKYKYDGAVVKGRNNIYILLLSDGSYSCWSIKQKSNIGGAKYTGANIEEKIRLEEWTLLYNLIDLTREVFYD